MNVAQQIVALDTQYSSLRSLASQQYSETEHAHATHRSHLLGTNYVLRMRYTVYKNSVQWASSHHTLGDLVCVIKVERQSFTFVKATP